MRAPASRRRPYHWALAVLAVGVISRLAAFPASIWDQDEAYFAAAVLRFDPAATQPHAPFFPLWIALGKLAHALAPGADPALGLRAISLLASALLPLVLLAVWRLVSSWEQGAAAAFLFLALPGPWILAGRAYTEPAATAFLLCGALLLLGDGREVPRLLAGSLALSAAFLVRPQWIPLVAVICLWTLWKGRGLLRILPSATATLSGLAALAVMARAAGGIGILLDAVRVHARYQGQTLGRFTFGLGDLALVPAAGGPPAALAWVVLAAVGALAVVRSGSPFGRRLLGLVLLPQLLLFAAAQNPTLPRYAIPILAESCGLVVLGLASVLGSARRASWAALLAALLLAVPVIPHLAAYRREPSPAARLVALLDGPSLAHTIIVADHHLAPILTLARAEGRLRQRVVWDWSVAAGRFSSPPREDMVALWDGPRPAWAHGGRVEVLETRDPLLTRLASPRFTAIRICRGCEVTVTRLP